MAKHFFTSESVGTWAEEQQIMTWKSGLGTGVDATMEERFVSPGRYVLTLVAKNTDGELLMNIVAEHTRAKRQKK